LFSSLRSFRIYLINYAGSFNIVEPDEYGILQNTISKELTTNRVYTSGRFFTGLSRTYIKFPRGRKVITFGSSDGSGDAGSLNIRLPDGQVFLDISFQYSISLSKIVDLYRNFGTNYHSRFITLAQSAIPQAYSNSSSVISDFYANRRTVSAIALTAVKNALGLYAVVHDLQLRAVSLPATNEKDIIAKITSEQKTKTANNVQKQQQVEAEITVILGQIQQEIALFTANQTQAANVVTQVANAYSKRVQLSAASVAWQNFQNILSFNNAETLRYIYLRSLQKVPAGSTLAVGFDNVASFVNSL
jgi:hypothetical protein